MRRLTTFLARALFFGVIVRFVLLFVLGLNIRHRDRLPAAGPAILAANHNSHLDAMVLLIAMPASLRRKVRPIAAADYFLRNRLLAWFALEVVGILPIARRRGEGDDSDPLADCGAALQRGEILIFFPEGTRGEPEVLGPFKKGIGILAERHPTVPIVPVYMHGLGKALPRNEALMVPFNLDMFVGQAMTGGEHGEDFVEQLRQRIVALEGECRPARWS